jgi:pimeloyl-ACP methyl ester carboxylesterase
MEARLEALRARLAGIRCPTLVVRGTESDVFSDDDAERFAAALPDARWVRIAGAGHTVQGDQPAALVREVRSFLRERFDPTPVGD